MNIISNATSSMMNEVIKLVDLKGGKYSYEEIKLFVDKDPHHQVNNAIRFDLLKKEKGIVELTDLGKEYISSDEIKKKEILKKNITKIKIFDILIIRLQLKGKLTKEQIANSLKSLTNRVYKDRSLSVLVNVLIKWLLDLEFATKEKDGSLKLKRRG